MIKPNSQKILLVLFDPEEKEKELLAGQLRLVCPQLSTGGFRSLLYFLKEAGWIFASRSQGISRYSLSQQGYQLVRRLFPALNSEAVTNDWQCLIFLNPPRLDPQFRYLRSVLVAHNGLPLNRGVYLFKGLIPPAVLTELESSYLNHVLAFSFQKWTLGDYRIVQEKHFHLQDIENLYSGVSREIEQLIDNDGQEKKADHGWESQFSLLFDRFWSTLRSDPGLGRGVSSQEYQTEKIINGFYTLLKLWAVQPFDSE